MKDFCKLALSVFFTLYIGAIAGASLAATTAPSEAVKGAAKRTPHEIVVEMASDQKAMNALLGKQNAELKTDAQRAAVAPKLVPLVRQANDDLTELAADVPQLAEQIGGSKMQLVSLLSVLGDEDATGQINRIQASKDEDKKIAGQALQMMSRFYTTENSIKAQTALIDDLEQLDRAHPDNVLLTQLTIEIGHDEISDDLKNRVVSIVTDEMKNSLAASTKDQLDAQKAEAMVLDKPLTLAGKTSEGKDFSTADLKGKVILVELLGNLVRSLQGRTSPRQKDVCGLSRQRVGDRKRFQ